MNPAMSQIRAMTIECEKVKGINLAQGICDLDTPSEVMDTAINSIKEGKNTYSRADGVEPLRIAVAEKLAKFNNIKADPEKNIIITHGATGGFYSALTALLKQGDEVIVFEPFYGYHINTLTLAGMVPKIVKMNPPNWTFSIDDIKITSKTKAILINTPSNPCGKVFSEKEIREIGELCLKNDLFLFTDEVYEYFIYSDIKHLSPASIDKFKHKVITISSYSKTFSITGWRVGYCVVNDEELAGKIKKVNDLIYICSPTPFQYAVCEGINKLPDSYYINLKNDLKIKRDKLHRVLNDKGFYTHLPEGAYYILSDISSLKGATGKEKAMYLLEKTGVAVVPGNEFFEGEIGNNFARFCFGKKDKDLDRACEQLEKLVV
ncbi:MAG: pyridoxal phosphate-dependent aminotransferase [Candidatus Sericytochromatia bacterium]